MINKAIPLDGDSNRDPKIEDSNWSALVLPEGTLQPTTGREKRGLHILNPPSLPF